MKGELRFALGEDGEPCVMMDGVPTTPLLLADNLASMPMVRVRYFFTSMIVVAVNEPQN